MPDPFTTVYQSILAALQAWSPLTQLVGPGAFLDMSDPSFSQFPPDAQAGDLPQLKLSLSTFALSPARGDSTTLEFSQSFELSALTDTLQITPINAIKYQAMRALLAAGPSLNCAFVKTFDITAGKDSPDQAKSRRWTSALIITVTIYQSRQQLANPDM